MVENNTINDQKTIGFDVMAFQAVIKAEGNPTIFFKNLPNLFLLQFSFSDGVI
jgi:hypothetical protein